MDEKYYMLTDYWWDCMPYGKALILEFEYAGINDSCKFCVSIPRRLIVSRRKGMQKLKMEEKNCEHYTY